MKGLGIIKGCIINSNNTCLNCTHYMMQHMKVTVTKDLRQRYECSGKANGLLATFTYEERNLLKYENK